MLDVAFWLAVAAALLFAVPEFKVWWQMRKANKELKQALKDFERMRNE